MFSSTTSWSATERSVHRQSFNAIVNGKEKAFDVPEAITFETTMGRSAEFGPDWVPNAVAARRLAGTLPPPDAPAGWKMTQSLTMSTRSRPSRSFSLTSLPSSDGLKSPTESPVARNPSTPTSSLGDKSQISEGGFFDQRPFTSPAGSSPAQPYPVGGWATNTWGANSMRLKDEPMPQTSHYWGTGEWSLSRDHFNSMVGGTGGKQKVKKCVDISESWTTHCKLGRVAERDPGWEPSAVWTRKLTGHLHKDFKRRRALSSPKDSPMGF